MTGGVYLITIGPNYYIGSSANTKKRESFHKSALKLNKHDNVFMQRSYNKYGSMNFVVLINMESGWVEQEQKFLDAVVGQKHCMNFARVAKAPNVGKHMSEETKRKRREHRKNNPMTENQKAAFVAAGIAARIGKPRSEELKKSLSQANLGKTPANARTVIGTAPDGTQMRWDSPAKCASKLGVCFVTVRRWCDNGKTLTPNPKRDARFVGWCFCYDN
jgi:group I intron endonuclease